MLLKRLEADAQVELIVYGSIPSSATKKIEGVIAQVIPPLPIPNREVKSCNADGTAYICGRVGRS